MYDDLGMIDNKILGGTGASYGHMSNSVGGTCELHGTLCMNQKWCVMFLYKNKYST